MPGNPGFSIYEPVALGPNLSLFSVSATTAMEQITSKLSDLKQQQFAHDSAAWAGLGRNNFYLLQLLLAGEGHVGSSTQSGFVRRLTSLLQRVGCLEAIWLSRNLSLHSLSSSKSSLSSRVF